MKIASKIKELCNNLNENVVLVASLLVLTSVMVFLFQPLCPPIDFYVHYNRLVVLMESVASGTFLTYMDYEVINGYGYILKVFYSDFLLIPFAVIGNLTKNPILAYESMIFILTFLSGIFMYWAVNSITNNKFSGFVAALLYTFCSYRIMIWYLRGAVGEVFALSFLPLILWGAYEIIYGDKKKWYILAIGFSLVIFSHVISSILSFVVVLMFILIYNKQFRKEPNRLIYLVVAGITTLFLTAYYTLPMIEQMLSNTFYYQTHQLIRGVLKLAITDATASLLNGVMAREQSIFTNLGSIFFFVLAARLFINRRTRTTKLADACTIVGLVLFFATTSFFSWDIYPFKLLETMQFSWRLYGIISLLFAFAGSHYIASLVADNSKKMIAIGGLIVIQVLTFNANAFYYKDKICKHGAPIIEVSTGYSAIIGAEYLPSKIPSPFITFFEERGQTVKSEHQSTITHFTKNKGHITFDAEVGNDDKLELPLTYYIGYAATLDGEALPYLQSENGLIEIPVNKSGKVKVIYTGTSLQRLSYYITIISILLFVGYIVLNNRKKNDNKINE